MGGDWCECNHVRDEHEGEYGECQVEGCDCIGFDARDEAEDEEWYAHG
jgi:hypothetical protein